MSIEQEKMIVESLSSLYPLQEFEEKAIDTVLNAIPHWIPVTERLPKESGLYQVTDMQGNVVRYVFNANEGSVEYWRRCVKAWMTLPEPYKEEIECELRE